MSRRQSTPVILLMVTHLDPCGDRPEICELSCTLVSTSDSRTSRGESSADGEFADDEFADDEFADDESANDLKSSGESIIDIDADESAAPVSIEDLDSSSASIVASKVSSIEL